MAGQDSVDEMEQMMLQMEQMKELIVVLKCVAQPQRLNGGCDGDGKKRRKGRKELVEQGQKRISAGGMIFPLLYLDIGMRKYETIHKMNCLCMEEKKEIKGEIPQGWNSQTWHLNCLYQQGWVS